MRPLQFLAAFLAAALVACTTCHAQVVVAANAALPAAALPAPSIAAAAHLLLDVTSGQTLAQVNADERRDPASLTKLMTAYIVFGALRAKTIQPSQMVNVSVRAWRAEGSRMFIDPKHAVSVDELVHGMIIQSGNDASIALAELVGGSEDAFVARMNAEATRLGMANTHFANVTGLSAPEHYSTAADLARLASAVIVDYPEFYPLYAQKEFRYNNITQPNRNRLLWTDPNVDGMKTGHTEAAGMVPHRLREAWRATRAGRRARRAVGCRQGGRSAEAPDLGDAGVRYGAALSIGQDDCDAARVEGDAR